MELNHVVGLGELMWCFFESDKVEYRRTESGFRVDDRENVRMNAIVGELSISITDWRGISSVFSSHYSLQSLLHHSKWLHGDGDRRN
ncbi:hypothetical protein RJT34_33091 [Clitoria ternatea]|uniref:Uncharacterized protein n=1 Tax=Clitoria ternatea TaxID=43366 RepID=A0AAN9EZH3_CLITE